MHPKDIRTSDFDYRLPEELIANYPLAERDASRLLIYEHSNIHTDFFHNLARCIPVGSVMVFNNTRVIEARIKFKKPTGGMVEIFCLEPATGSMHLSEAMNANTPVEWKCLVGGASKWKHGLVLSKTVLENGTRHTLRAYFIEKLPDCFVIRFEWTPVSMPFSQIIHRCGKTPLPPYIHREAENSDRERYQTIYAARDGSVAAPTAGLHFTDKVFQSLDEKNIRKEYITLHVGAGTFRPVNSTLLEGHEMHEEFMEVNLRSIQTLLREQDKDVVAVGTTSLRTLESLYWIGQQLISGAAFDPDEIAVGQWYPYGQHTADPAPGEALEALVSWMESEKRERLVTRTRLLIAPPYRFRIARRLVTNFHQPRSTLLLIVAAFIGNDWKKVYDYAVRENFRFLSYGDACLLSSDNS